ncbi:MAG: OsmC family peroxiredoxin [Verrucomicrobiaceae bacterium]|nr:OsmC family peroxiredoxin [Verrucomicrobiaceae bacterium]
MSEHRATLTWKHDGGEFTYKAFTREHRWDFGNGQLLNASAAPSFLGDEELVDPEQAYVASLSSCHALTFLAICSMQGIAVESYTDEAVGFLEKADDGKPWLARVELHPKVTFGNESKIALDNAKVSELHDKAHLECFLARSVKTRITVIH